MNDTWVKTIEAAYPLFMENGYKKTTTGEIAKSAGINESTIFRTFKNKERLFQLSIDYFAKKAIKSDFNILDYTGDLTKDLGRMIQAIYNLSLELIPSYRLLIKRSLVDEKILEDIKSVLQKQESLFSHYISGMISRNMIKDLDSDVVTNLIYSKVFISSFELLIANDKENLENKINEMTQYFAELLRK